MSLLPDPKPGFNHSHSAAMTARVMFFKSFAGPSGIDDDHQIQGSGEDQSHAHAGNQIAQHDRENAAHDHRQSDDQGQNLGLWPPDICVLIRFHQSDLDTGSTPYVRW